MSDVTDAQLKQWAEELKWTKRITPQIIEADTRIDLLIREVRRLQELVACEWCGGKRERMYRHDKDKCHNCNGTGIHRCEGKP